MSRARSLVAGVALMIALAPEARAARVLGVVRSLQRPIAGVHVLDPAAGAYAATDTAGRFELVLAPGVHELQLAAVGYEARRATITVPDSATVDTGPWLLAPLRPDGPVAAAAPQAAAPVPTPAATTPTSAASVLDRTPTPARLAPDLTFEWNTPERERWLVWLPADALAPGAPEGLAREILRSIATSDSITASTGGTGAPGTETWRQWGDRLGALALEPALATDAPTLRRAVAYARTRGALASGPTWGGYQSAKLARVAIGTARGDGANGSGNGAAFLGRLQGALDAVFVPGGEPAKPKPAPAPKKKKKRTTRRR